MEILTNSNSNRQDVVLPSSLTGKCIFSVDVEDWFHILQVSGAPPIQDWDALPSVVEANFRRLLEMFEKAGVRVTCFFLGWIAQRYPNLVREALRAGHEIASHGYAHRLVFEMSEQEFRDDAVRARRILEDLTGCRVEGYRSAGFSVTDRSEWFFDALQEAGYKYDSSVFPVARQHGGIAGARRVPHTVPTKSGQLVEFPISVADGLGRAMCFFGGGYLRLFPYRTIRRMTRQVLSEGRPVLFYVHPREIDPGHPRLRMPILRRFKSYVNLHTTETKIQQLLAEFSFVTFREFLDDCEMTPKQQAASK